MIPEIGHFALILALAMAISQSVLPLFGASNGNSSWIALAKPSARAQFLFLLLSYACLTWAFMTDDFSVALAANHSNSLLPAVYKFTAVWGNHEGSILLWALILGGWTYAVTLYSKQLDERTQARVLGVMGLISCGFMLFTLLTSNPFERCSRPPRRPRPEPAAAGPGHDHPPADALHGLCRLRGGLRLCHRRPAVGRLDAAWARWSRPWTTWPGAS
jgi:cytochrome c-type biogenesis protein CcmF